MQNSCTYPTCKILKKMTLIFQTWLLPLSERLSLDAQDHKISTFLEAIKLVQLQETFSIDKKIGESTSPKDFGALVECIFLT